MATGTALVGAVVSAAGCAAQSCPAIALGSGVHVDASAWAGSSALTARVCVATDCVVAAPTNAADPDDLFGFVGITTGTVRVRVELTAADGRTLDRTTTGTIILNKPFGSGCGGREEVDLTVTSAGALVAGQPGKIG